MFVRILMSDHVTSTAVDVPKRVIELGRDARETSPPFRVAYRNTKVFLSRFQV